MARRTRPLASVRTATMAPAQGAAAEEPVEEPAEGTPEGEASGDDTELTEEPTEGSAAGSEATTPAPRRRGGGRRSRAASPAVDDEAMRLFGVLYKTAFDNGQDVHDYAAELRQLLGAYDAIHGA